MWRVHGVEGNVQEEGPLACVVANELRRVLANQFCGVAFLAQGPIVLMPIEAAVALVGEVVKCAVVVAVLLGETAPRRQVLRRAMSQVPLAENAGDVSGRL